ncbi:hypothetical protein TNCV_1581201 [Trichonephila clavipes]|nr:hypothetical protein TNCV_1581201 [Trichonephila clavipes]
MADEDILEFVQSSKNIIDAESDNENERGENTASFTSCNESPHWIFTFESRRIKSEGPEDQQRRDEEHVEYHGENDASMGGWRARLIRDRKRQG